MNIKARYDEVINLTTFSFSLLTFVSDNIEDNPELSDLVHKYSKTIGRINTIELQLMKKQASGKFDAEYTEKKEAQKLKISNSATKLENQIIELDPDFFEKLNS